MERQNNRGIIIIIIMILLLLLLLLLMIMIMIILIMIIIMLSYADWPRRRPADMGLRPARRGGLQGRR